MRLSNRAIARSTDALVTNTSGLRLRSAPGLGSTVLASLGYGTLLRYLSYGGWADGYEWLEVLVESTGREGYVAAIFVDTPEGGDYPIGSTFHVDTTSGGANLRSAASTSSGVIRVVPNRTNGTIVGGPTSAGGYTWYRVTVAGSTGYMATVVMAPGAYYGGRPRIRVWDGPLNVWQWAGLDGPVITSVPTGATGEITEAMPVTRNGYIWVNVRFFNQANTTGWVAQQFLAWT
jgi:uncharacterized protein YgiM (DUF1202 family)